MALQCAAHRWCTPRVSWPWHLIAIAWRWDGIGAIILGSLVVLYHYRMNRKILNTLHRIANAVENLEDSKAQPGEQEPHIETGDGDGG